MRKHILVGFVLTLAIVGTLITRSEAVTITWQTLDCLLYYPLYDENYDYLEGANPDTTRCAHGPYDLVYLVWDRDADGIDSLVTCARELTGDTVVDSTFIGKGMECPGCSTGAFLETTEWLVTTGDYDTFYVIALNDSTLQGATYYGTTEFNSPPVWEIYKDWTEYTIICNENYPWNTNIPLEARPVFNGSSIVVGPLQPGDRKVGMERIAARGPASEALWTYIQVDNGPSGWCVNAYTDIDSVKIYKESGDPSSGFDPAEDALIGEEEWGPGSSPGGTATVTFFSPETLGSDSSFYYIAFDIEPGADPYHCASACVHDSSYVGIPELCRDGNFPFCSEDVALPVEISRFEALPGDRLMLLEWTTESEIDNKGFYIYRSVSRTGEFLRVNQEIIPGAGNSYFPIDYVYTDLGLENGSEYFYKLVSVTYGNALLTYEELASGIPTRENRRMAEGRLFESSPNPFARSTSITYVLEAAGISNVSLAVYDLSGRLVRILVDGYAGPGLYNVEWDGRDESGATVASGLYFCQLRNGGSSSVMKMLRIE